MRYKPVVLLILDGWGVARPARGNAITQAKTPVTDSLIASFPHGVLSSMGGSVGLPWKEMGNSEVGHLAMGTGRVLFQDLMRINNAIESGSLEHNKVLETAFKQVKELDSNLHLWGLASDGGVHGHITHLLAILGLAKKYKIKQAFLHLVLDGRDTARDNGIDFIKTVEEEIARIGFGRIATVIGRFWAMDRDNHWQRTKKAYDLMVSDQAEITTDQLNLKNCIKEKYQLGIYDEEMPPISVNNGESKIKYNDVIILTNFRADRARQITKAFSLPTFTKFERKNNPKNFLVATMTTYDEFLPVEVIFSQEKVDNSLAKLISKAGLKQLHIGETEKYAHITYFFDGYKENPLPGEEYALVKSVDEDCQNQPEMGAYSITNKVERVISQNRYDFILVNFANADMVGHTGDLKATIKAVEVVDECIGRIIKASLSINGVVIVTADHGNAEEMINPNTGEVVKSHTTNPVPIWLVGQDFRCVALSNTDLYSANQTPVGILADVAATVLDLLDVPADEKMEGRSLVDLLKC